MENGKIVGVRTPKPVSQLTYDGTRVIKSAISPRMPKLKTRVWANAQRDGRLPNIGGALCSTPKSLADAHYQSAVQ